MTDPNFFIESERLYLCYFQPDDDSHCDFLVRLYNTPEFITSIGGKPTPITTRQAARALMRGRFLSEHAHNGYGNYLILLKPGEGEHGGSDGNLPFQERAASCTLVGTVCLLRDTYTAPDLGFAVLTEYCRRGIATEAARALLAYAQREKGVSDVLGFTDPTNAASRGVFRRLGFEERGSRVLKALGGVTAAVYALPGVNKDLSVYGIPREESTS